MVKGVEEKKKIWFIGERRIKKILEEVEEPTNELKGVIRDRLYEITKEARINKVARKYENRDRCRKEALVFAVGERDEGGKLQAVKVKVVPVLCGWYLCKVDARHKGERYMKRIREVMEYLPRKAYFYTLTFRDREIQGVDDVVRVEYQIREWKRRMYQLRLGERGIKKFKKIFEEELKKYQERLQEKVRSGEMGIRVVKRKIQTQKRLFGEFLRYVESFKGKKLGQIMVGIVKEEVVLKERDGKVYYHPHLHIVSMVPIPKVLIQGVWGRIVGDEVITDARLVKGRKRIVGYLGKYVVKGVVKVEGKVEDDVLIEVGAVFYKRRYLEIWGVRFIDTQEGWKEVKYIGKAVWVGGKDPGKFYYGVFLYKFEYQGEEVILRVVGDTEEAWVLDKELKPRPPPFGFELFGDILEDF